MLDFDIAGQLFPNPLTMLTQLCATGILFFFVKKYLWNSARRMMAKRSELVQSELDQSNADRTAAQADREAARAELSQAAQLSATIVAKAKEEGLQVKEQLVKAAKKEADDKLQTARQEIDYEQKQMRRKVTVEMIEVAMNATEKLLETKATEQEDQKAIEQFVKEIRERDESGN